MSNTDTEDFLEHYGIKGMKWGRRTGGLGARATGAQLDRNQRHQEIAKRAISGKGTLEEKLAQAPARLVLGKKRFEKMANKQLGKLEKRQARIESGKRNLGDKLDLAMNLKAVDLVVSRRDRKTEIADNKSAARAAKKG